MSRRANFCQICAKLRSLLHSTYVKSFCELCGKKLGSKITTPLSLQKMAILLILDDRDNQVWTSLLQKALPATRIEVYPTVKNPLEVAFIVSMRPKKEQVKKFPNATVIHALGAGVNYILEAEVLQPGMQLARVVDDYLTKDMFEFVLGVVIRQIKHLPTYHAFQQQQKWQQLPYKRFEDTKVAVLGLGEIGSYVAQQFATLGFKVSGWSNSPKQLKGVSSYQGTEGLKDCLQGADFLINILPLTAATKGILNKETFSYLPKGAFLINVGRGAHNQEEDIVESIENGQLSGALLDVFKTEPLPAQHPFWQHPKIQITPHIASLSNPETVVAGIVENFERFQRGERLLNLVHLEKGY